MRTIEPTQTPSEVPAGRPRRVAWWIVAAVTVLIAGALTWWITSDDDPDPDPGPGATDTTTTVDTPTTATDSSTTTTDTPTADPTAIWPAPGTDTRFATPEEAARSFATDFLGFRRPVAGEFRQGDTRSGEVPIRPKANGPETTVLVRQLSRGDAWSVIGATTEDISVDTPAPMGEIASPVDVTGSARAFEGHVQVVVRQDGNPGPIGEGFVTGGGDSKRPFRGTIAFDTPTEPYGTLVFFASSAENGEVWQATTVRVRLSSTDAGAAACGTKVPQHLQPGEGQMEVTAWFSCDAPAAADGAVTPVRRLVPTSPRVLQASLAALLAGPTADEKQAGIGSWFSTATDDLLRSVTITDGHAVVDFGNLTAVIPNASTSAGSRRLLAELDATVFQFPSVRTAEYRIEGSCENFTEWLQLGGCDPRTRPASTD